MYDFDENGNLAGSLRAESELPTTDVPFSNGWLVGNGTSPISCCGNTPGFISIFASVTRGWNLQREYEDGRTVHYLRRLEQTPEEGYYSCHINGQGNTPVDSNSPVGVYILYPSEWPSLMI